MEHGRIKSVETAGPAKIAAFDTKKRGREEAGEDGHIKAESDNNPNKRLQQQQSDTISALEAAPNGGDSSCSSAAVDLTRSTGLIVSTVPIEATGNAAQVEPVHGRNGLPDVSAAATADVAGARAEAGPGGTGAGVEVKKCEVCEREDRRYCCPRCSKLTCSLRCCVQHKKTDSCSGQRDKVAFVGLKEFTDSQLRSDFNFLEDALRCMDGGRRGLSSRPGIIDSNARRGRGGRSRGRGRGRGRSWRGGGEQTPVELDAANLEEKTEGGALGLLSGQTSSWLKGRAPRLQRLVKEAAMRGTRLLLMPEGMARSVSNTTAIISNKKQHAVGGGGRGRGRSKRNSTSGRGGRGHVGAVPGRGSRDTLSASGKGHEASSGEQGGVVHASDISGCSRGVAGSQVDQVIMATNDEDIMAPREPKQAVAVLAGPLKISHDVVVKQKPVDADEQAKEGARSVVQTSSASEAVVCRSEASVPADRAPRTASNADSSGRAAICTTGEACPAGGPLILGGSSILEGNQAQQGPPEANDSRVIAPPSRLLLQIGNPQSDGRRKWEGDKGGGAQGATNSSIAWRVEWLFSGVTSAGDGVGEGLMVADDAVPEGRSLHEALARHLEPREGNAPLRHRLRKFSKPWAVMVRAFARRSAATVKPTDAAIDNTDVRDTTHCKSAPTGGVDPKRGLTASSGLSGGGAVSTSGSSGSAGVPLGALDGHGVEKVRGGGGSARGGVGDIPALRLFLQRVPCSARKPLYWEIYPEDTLGSALEGKTVIEFPTIYVALPGVEASKFHTLVTDISSNGVDGCVDDVGRAVGSCDEPVGEDLDDSSGEDSSSSNEDSSSSGEEDSSSGVESDSDGDGIGECILGGGRGEFEQVKKGPE